MSSLAELCSSPKVGLIVFGPFIALAMLKGCSDYTSRVRPPGR